MWWLNPAKEILNVVFNRILAPYVENLDLDQLNYGIGQGRITLRKLRLKKSALDKFRLPIDVLEGHLGTFTVSLHWMNLGNQPVEIFIEDLYLLAVPSPQTNVDPKEEESREQATKMERLQNAELLHMRGQAEVAQDSSPQNQGLVQSLLAKVLNNVQITVKNIHIRYEDKLSVPDHPFAAGITLAGFTAFSTNDNWESAFIESTAGSIRKLAKLQSLAVYFDTDAPSLQNLASAEFVTQFQHLISDGRDHSKHQFILRPVSGQGRVIMNNSMDAKTPHFDVELLFDEIGVSVDSDQYRDVISLIDMYHVYMRQRQYRKFHPKGEIAETTAKARLRFAGGAILDNVHEKNRKWTWAYFAERRDDRRKYVDLFKKKTLNPTMAGPDLSTLDALERKLSYEDIRFYRSIARSDMKKDDALRKRLEEHKKKQEPPKQSWGGWLWGSSQSSNGTAGESAFGDSMTDEQRKELYDVLDFDEKAAVAESFQASKESLKLRIMAKLSKGSFALRSRNQELLSIQFDDFQSCIIQRPDNFEASICLSGFGVHDGTTQNTLYPQIAQVKKNTPSQTPVVALPISHEKISDLDAENAFFFLKFEHNPLDERADNALTVKMRHMEIVYHKVYVEAVYKFFKPPASQLESVEALLNVASQTLDGLRKETRAGLEYALQTHKTIDVQMDMNAPIIIIPEDITTKQGTHLVIDAGHISIESDLADKKAVRDIYMKRNKQYSDDDYKELESLMYDKMSLRLKDAQFLIGNDLQSCLDALNSHSKDSLRLMERISLDFQVQNSIVPGALNLARFKVSGKLPSLEVNMSDTKYKSLMRLVDVCIPKFDDNDRVQARPVLSQSKTDDRHGTFQLPPLFGQIGAEYNVEEDDDDVQDEQDTDQFFEAPDGSVQRPDLHQHIFELDFEVDNLKASIGKTYSDGTERSLGDVSFNGFSLSFALAKYDMRVNINLQSLTMNLVQPGREPIKFMSSAVSDLAPEKDLLKIAYVRAQRASPEFETLFEGIDQSVDIQISTFVFQAAPEPVVTLYDFVMTTFVPNSNTPTRPPLTVGANTGSQSNVTTSVPTPIDSGKIQVKIKLDSIQLVLINEQLSLATLSLSTADVMVLLASNTMNVAGRLGSLALSNDSSVYHTLSDFDHILSIEGDNFAEFKYQTFDPNSSTYSGVKSSVYLKAASVKMHFLEGPLHDIYLFLMKLARLKGLYDAATQVAVKRASEIEHMHYEVLIKSPIVIIPSSPSNSRDALIMRLGEISAKNESKAAVDQVFASLKGIQLKSRLFYDGSASELKIIDDINITADVTQTAAIDRTKDCNYPDTQVAIKISDIRLHLTQVQYQLLMVVLQAVPRVLDVPPSNEGTVTSVSSSSSNQPPPPPHSTSLTALEPELRAVPPSGGARIWTTVDLVVSVDAVKLHLYDSYATTEANVKEHGIARFALNSTTLRLKILSDGALEAQVVLKSFLMSNTRPGPSKFREIIPAAQHERNQFMLLYTAAGDGSNTSLAVLTVDSPKVIFAIDPVFALLDYFMSAFQKDTHTTSSPTTHVTTVTQASSATQSQPSSIDFRVDLHDVSLSVLENDTALDSQSITLSIKQLFMSQQGVLALTINQLGMSLMKMNKTSESVRFLDEVDMTLSLDNRSSSSHQQMLSIEVNSKAITFRASYRDINLITSIVNKALALYADSQQGSTTSTTDIKSSAKSITPRSTSIRTGQPFGKASVLMSKEQFTGNFDGFSLVLIGDMHEQPMLHVKVNPFVVGAKDWSGELQAKTTLATQISYWNLTNSHWEPFIDPWTYTISLTKESPDEGLNINLSAQERLDVNISTTFAELLLTSVKLWTQEGESVLQKARGSYAPYRIRNRTGFPICVWADGDGSGQTSSTALEIANDRTIDWRFDDWRTAREHISSHAQQNIGVQFMGKPWEYLRGIPLAREGEYTFTLKPHTDKYPMRVLCEVQLVDNVKVVTIRSTYIVQNFTLYPLELTLVDDRGHPVYSIEKIAPGGDYAVPIEAVMMNRIRIQPDQGFGYKWCPALQLDDLLSKKTFTIKCSHSDPNEAAFRFQAWVDTDAQSEKTRCPKVALKLRAPVELENLLPYDIQYRIFDKNTNQNWRSFLRKGGIMPVHSVELGHLVLLNIMVQDTVFKQSEFAIINTDGNSEFDVENRLTIRDASDRKLDLRLNYIRYPDSGGAFKLQIFSPHVVVNKTGLALAIRSVRRAGAPQDAAGDHRPDVLSSSTPFMLSHPQESGHEYIFRLGDSAWSKTFSVKVPSAETEIIIPSRMKPNEEIHAGISWSEGLGKYKLSKVITLTPRFMVKNGLQHSISIREHGVPPGERSILVSGERCPLITMHTGQARLLTFAYPGLNAEWTPPVRIEDIGTVHLRLRIPNDSNTIHLMKSTVEIDGCTIFVTLAPADDEWPFIIENTSQFPVVISQTDGNDPPSKPIRTYNLAAHSNMKYAWDAPAAAEKKILLQVCGSSRVVDILEIGDLVPFKFNNNNRNRAVSLDIRADGPQQILCISDYNPEVSLYRPKRRDTVSVHRQDSISSSTEGFEAITEQVPPSFVLNIDLSGIGVSLVNRQLAEVIYITLKRLKFEYMNSPVAQSVNVTCGSLQIDNQLHDAIYPVILQPTPIQKDSAVAAALPTVQASVIWLKDEEHGVTFVKYCSILLQALTIETDEDLLFSLYDLIQIKGATWEDDAQDVLIQDAGEILEPKTSTSGDNMYFEVLELQPVQLSLSFMRTERTSSGEKLVLRNPLAILLNAITMMLGNVNDAPLELNALAIKDMRLTSSELQDRIMYHYRQDILRQFYRILGSVDFIGNPVGLFNNVSSGVADIFYEPFNGVVMHGNKELGIGIAKGAASFVKKTVFGVTNSMTKFTSSVGKGLSAATFDSEYQAKRRMNQRRNRPRHAIYGVAAGGEAFASSMASAVEGVLMKPIEGAETEGAFGFFKGVGKGLAGAVTKPVVGVFDLAANVTEGIRNTTTVFDTPGRERVRFPRHTPKNGVLKPYSEREALGQYWMKDLDNGAYRQETYIAHINTPGGDNVILLTTTRVLSFWSKRLRLEWELPFTSIQGVTVEDTGIRFSHRAGKENDKFIFIPDKPSQSWFFHQISQVVKTLNARRRMDS